MEMKNIFFIYNTVLSELYRCRIYNDLGQRFLPMLKMLIPFRYARCAAKNSAIGSICWTHFVSPPSSWRPNATTYVLRMMTKLVGSVIADSPRSFVRAIS